MKISKIELENVKSFNQKVSIDFSDGLNVVIGSNAGGKSNLLEVTQAILNDLFFDDFSFQDNNNDAQSETIRPYKVERRQINQQNLQQLIFDRFEGNLGGTQRISVFLKIEKTDISNLISLRDNKDKLIEFERQQIFASALSELISSLDFGLNYEALIDQEIEVSST